MSDRTTTPRVSVGLPVRNGGELLSEALRRLVQQSWANFELCISDNASSDQTESICRSFAEHDPRIRYVRQRRTLSALDNFRFVFEQTSAPYFMWASHDDRHSLNYIQTLASKLDECPNASLAFSDYMTFRSHTDSDCQPFPAEPRQRSDSIHPRFSRRIYTMHMYALMRRAALQSYRWYDIDYGPDVPLLSHLAFRGDFVYAPGASFFYYCVEKDPRDRAFANSLRTLRRLPRIRLAWTIAKAIRDAKRAEGKSAYACQIVPSTMYVWGRRSLYEATPDPVKKLWQRYRRAHPTDGR